MSRKNRSKSLRLLLLAGAVSALVAAACTSGSNDSFEEAGGVFIGDASPATTVAASSAAERISEPPSVNADQLGPAGVTPSALQTSIVGREIIFTADLTVAVTDVAGAVEEATRLIQGLGGFLFGQRTVGSPEPVSVLTFKVEPEDFQEALSRLGSIGEIRTQNVSASDVTERIVDLESRINTATASVERLRGFLEDATDIKSIVELENELLARETQLETLRGQLRTLQDQVALATIILTLTEAASRPAIELSVTAYPAHDNGLSCPGGPQLSVEQDTEATVCFEITNVGDTWLTGFELRDPVLDLEIEDLIVVFGDLTTAIEPGQSVILAAELVPERSLRTQTTVTAEPVSEEGEPLPGRLTARTITIFIDAVDPGGIPTFTDGLQASWDVLVRLGQTLLLTVGALIPFIWVPVVLWLVWRVRRTRSAQTPSDLATASEGSSDED